MNWLSDELKEDVRSLFEPRYKRQLTDDEIDEIANNLTNFLEAYFKFKWRNIYEKRKD